jgi:hypothetical protein
MKAPAWSFSSLNDFENCPRAYQLKRVTKECKTVESEAMRHGTIQHEHLETRARDKTTLPKELEWFEPSMKRLEETGATIIAEQAVGLTKGLTPTTFFGKDVWVRGKLDLTLRHKTTSTVLDWKTGKRKLDSDQLMLFAGFEFASRPEVDEVKTGYVWLKDRKIDTETFTRKDVPMIWGHFMPKVERIERAYEKDEWPCKPSGLCGWCPASKAQCKNSKK